MVAICHEMYIGKKKQPRTEDQIILAEKYSLFLAIIFFIKIWFTQRINMIWSDKVF